MKKLSILFVAAAVLCSNAAHADTAYRNKPPVQQTNNDEFQWGLGLIGIAVLGTVVGLTAASASSTPSTYSTSN